MRKGINYLWLGLFFQRYERFSELEISIESSKTPKSKENKEQLKKKQKRISKDNNKRCNVCVIEISEENKVTKGEEIFATMTENSPQINQTPKCRPRKLRGHVSKSLEISRLFSLADF